MSRPHLNIIAAIGRNRELGKENGLIWRIPEDLKRVKALTMGHPLIMGRRTYESIGRPLPGRTMIVITSKVEPIDGCIVTHSFDEALQRACEIDQEEVFIFGGAQVYKEALSHADRLYLTHIEATDSKADAYFPEYETLFTKILAQESFEHEGLKYSWTTLERS